MLSLDFTGCSALTSLSCNTNGLTDLILTGCTALKDLDCHFNFLTDLNLSDCANLVSLYCWNNELTNLDISNCTHLTSLNCNYNKLTNINLSGCTALESINCGYNQFQLSDLFEIQLMGVNDMYFGAQNLLPQTAIIGTELFSEQSIFDGIFTDYSVTKDSAHVSESDYSVVDGKLTFNTPGSYVVTMTNTAIGSHAEVIVPIEILTVNIRENVVSNIKIYPNPTTGQLTIENGELKIKTAEVFDIYGRLISSLSLVAEQSRTLGEKQVVKCDISNLPPSIYLLNIVGKTFKIIKIDK
jgi:Leucine-rich repeat (LRR) protein